MVDKKYLNSRQAALYLGVSRYTLYSYIKEGKLTAHKFGGNAASRKHYRFLAKDLDKLIKGEDKNVGQNS